LQVGIGLSQRLADFGGRLAVAQATQCVDDRYPTPSLGPRQRFAQSSSSRSSTDGRQRLCGRFAQTVVGQQGGQSRHLLVVAAKLKLLADERLQIGRVVLFQLGGQCLGDHFAFSFGAGTASVVHQSVNGVRRLNPIGIAKTLANLFDQTGDCRRAAGNQRFHHRLGRGKILCGQ